jgi:hypothetical protein
MRSLRRPAFVKRHRSSTTTWHKMHITQAMQPALLVGMQTVTLTAAQCRQLAGEHKARAKVTGLSLKRVSLHTNIARSFSGLASQLEMLAEDVTRDCPKGWTLLHIKLDTGSQS